MLSVLSEKVETKFLLEVFALCYLTSLFQGLQEFQGL